MKVLVTGGAGFVGSHLVDVLVERGDDVVVFDLLDPQVHLVGRPAWLRAEATYAFSDFRCHEFREACSGADAVVHLAAMTGTGQSMYRSASYADGNATTAAWLADLLTAGVPIGHVVFASSRAVYGEGPGLCLAHGRVRPEARTKEQLQEGRWAAACPLCGDDTLPVAVSERDAPRPLSVYASTKVFGEDVLRMAAEAAGVPLTVLRLFNLYGPRQTPGNPYVGVASAFAARAIRRLPLALVEDGRLERDFLHVHDAVAAIVLALDARRGCSVLNIGSGQSTTLHQLAALVASAAGVPDLPITATGESRVGDLRACVADVHRATAELGWRPAVSLTAGVQELVDYVRDEPMADVNRLHEELAQHGMLTRRSDERV